MAVLINTFMTIVGNRVEKAMNAICSSIREGNFSNKIDLHTSLAEFNQVAEIIEVFSKRIMILKKNKQE